jgi:hypothetical protein
LGTRYLDQLRAKNHRHARLAFLDLLQRDLPCQILCHYCRRLHSSTESRHNTRWDGKLARCTREDDDSYVDEYIQDGFSSATFQSAMKLHRYGLNCSKQLSLLTGFHSSFEIGHNYQWESTPRIVNGHFLLRHQAWFLFPVGWDVRLPSTVVADVCPHWTLDSYSGHSTRLETKIACRMSHWDDVRLNSRCRTCSGLFQCKRCPTEFQIDVKDFLENGVALILTRWLDLGEGRTPLDPRYASHVIHKHCRRYSVPVRFEAGSIRAAFEGGDFDIETLLTPKHKEHLFMQNPLPWKKDVHSTRFVIALLPILTSSP